MKKPMMMIGCIAVAFAFAGCSRTANTAMRNQTQPEVSITAADDGSFSIAGERCPPGDLASRLRQKVARGTTVAIVQNKDVTSDQFMAMMQACEAAGVRGITLATAKEQR